MLVIPRLARLPRTRPQVKATNLGLASRYWRHQEACRRMVTKIFWQENVTTHLGQELERIVLQDIDTLVIGAQVVDLFPTIKNMNERRRWEIQYYLKTATQKSLQMNLRRSSSSLNFG